MRAICNCGFEFYAGNPGVVCPQCHSDAVKMFSGVLVDFNDYRSVLSEVEALIKPSIIRHTDWSDYTIEQMFDAVLEEMDELREAIEGMDISGRHGVIRESLDVMVVLTKLVRRLRCLQ